MRVEDNKPQSISTSQSGATRLSKFAKYVESVVLDVINNGFLERVKLKVDQTENRVDNFNVS